MSLSNPAAYGPEEVAAVLDCIVDPASLLAPDGRVLAANRAFRERFPVDDGCIGRMCHELTHGSAEPCPGHADGDCPLRAAVRTGRRASAVHVHATRDGLEKHAVATYPIPRDGGPPRTFVEVVRRLGIVSTLDRRERLVGESPAFRRMLDLVRRVAPHDTPVLLLGESGTGKEPVAREIHGLGPREHGPFVTVDCSGVAEPLLERELFGVDDGRERRCGLVESAADGTLFLDEVGDLPAALQAKLVRLLERRTFRRVGGDETIRARFRLVTATYRDLRAMMAEGGFRLDLYFRISAFPITVPPLREREGDVPLLADALLRRLEGDVPRRIEPAAAEALARYPFPGNVRELRNVLERACLLSEGDVLRPGDLPPEVRRGRVEPFDPPASDRVVALDEVEAAYVRWARRRFEGDNRALARRLGVSERTLYRRLRNARDAD